jgi:capsular exopolysaccharide synthesis family protein
VSFRELVRAVLRWWWLLVLPVVIGALTGWLTAPPARPMVPKYHEATQTLIVKPDPTMFTPSNPATIALLASQGEVASRAASELVDDPSELNGVVEITGDPALAVVNITAYADDAAWAEEVADTFARVLADYLSEQEAVERQSAIDGLRAEAEALLARVADIDEQMRASPSDVAVLREQREALLRQHDDATGELTDLETSPGVEHPVVSVGPAVARAVYPAAPRSATERAVILAVLGLLAGGALLLVVHRLDVRIRDTADARKAFGLPVLAEIPTQRRRRARGVAVRDAPGSPVAEAYRTLSTTMLLDRPIDRADRGGHVVVVTSTRRGEGKTTTVANLAAALADGGSSVLGLGADLRRPTVHQRLGVARAPGITEVLVARGGLALEDVVQQTRSPRITVAASGAPHDNPGELAVALPSILDAARGLADIVLVDTTPLLQLTDAVALVAAADAVVLVARARRTTFDAAARANEVLRRVRAHVTGVVLVGARETSGFLAEPDGATTQPSRTLVP